jgi:mevalonate kinase
VYVSLIDEFATGSSASVSIVYVAPIFYRVKVSNTRNATKLKRFVTDDTTSGTDRNVATIRNTDTIHT